MALTRSYVLDDDDRFASLHEQWLDHVRRRYHRGPDPLDELVAAVVGLRPHTALEIGGGGGRFAGRLSGHLRAPVVLSDANALAVAHAGDRGLAAVAATAACLPFATDSFDCVVTRTPRWRDDVVDAVLREIARLIGDDGAFVLTTASPERDGHELDQVLGCTLRRPTCAFMGDAAEAALVERFDHVTRTDLDHALVFPSSPDLAAYLRAVPTRRHLADRIDGVDGPVRLRYRTSLFVASAPMTD